MLAAVDLGSNSFRMAIARQVGEELRLVDRLREGVRLAECLDENRNLTAEGRERALDCLVKFGQRLRDFPPAAVRVVGTNTLRKARKAGRFLQEAEEALGFPIEIISGQEEARLIYLGVSHSIPAGDEKRLVVDIGGGSTECIVGEAFEPRRAESLYMGCVSYTMEHFPDGRISRRRLRAAEIAARLEMRPIKAEMRRIGWRQAVGSSGTILAVDEILHLNGWSERGITLEGLRKLRLAMLEAGHVDELSLDGLGKERAKVLPGGLAVLLAVFESLGVERMTVSPGALREGVLYDLVGRFSRSDVRDRTIQRFVEQYHVDAEQAQRVSATALHLLDGIAADWDLDPDVSRSFLSWAAMLHEIGLSIAHGGYHKHGAYVIANSDMPGFSVRDQKMLSLLVRGMRRKFPWDLFDELPPRHAASGRRLCTLLRLAVLLNRSRSSRPRPALRLGGGSKSLKVRFPAGWLDEHPLTAADLEQEREFLEAAGLKLRVKEYGPPEADDATPASERRPNPANEASVQAEESS